MAYHSARWRWEHEPVLVGVVVTRLRVAIMSVDVIACQCILKTAAVAEQLVQNHNFLRQRTTHAIQYYDVCIRQPDSEIVASNGSLELTSR